MKGFGGFTACENTIPKLNVRKVVTNRAMPPSCLEEPECFDRGDCLTPRKSGGIRRMAIQQARKQTRPAKAYTARKSATFCIITVEPQNNQLHIESDSQAILYSLPAFYTLDRLCKWEETANLSFPCQIDEAEVFGNLLSLQPIRHCALERMLNRG